MSAAAPDTSASSRMEGRRPAVGQRARGLLRPAFAPVDIASLACFRVAFGAVMVWEVYRYFTKGWIASYYIRPEFYFTYYGFGWVRPWPGEGMYVHFAVMGLAALCVALGPFYRASAAVFFFAFTYVFLLHEQPDADE